MKNILKKTCAFFASFIMIFCLFGCDSDKSDNLKKAYEENGYSITVLDESNSVVQGFISLLDEEDQEEAKQYEFVIASKSILDSATYVKYPSAEKLKEDFTDENGDTTRYDEAVANGKINLNCYLIIASSDAATIFKQA